MKNSILLFVLVAVTAETTADRGYWLSDEELPSRSDARADWQEYMQNDQKRTIIRSDLGKRESAAYEQGEDLLAPAAEGTDVAKRPYNMRGSAGFIRSDMGKRFAGLRSDMGKRSRLSVVKKLMKTMMQMKPSMLRSDIG